MARSKHPSFSSVFIRPHPCNAYTILSCLFQKKAKENRKEVSTNSKLFFVPMIEGQKSHVIPYSRKFSRVRSTFRGLGIYCGKVVGILIIMVMFEGVLWPGGGTNQGHCILFQNNHACDYPWCCCHHTFCTQSHFILFIVLFFSYPVVWQEQSNLKHSTSCNKCKCKLLI